MSGPAVTEPRWTTSVDEFPRALSWAPEGEAVAVGTARGTVSILGATDGAAARTFSLSGTGVSALAWNPRAAKVAVGAEDGAVSVLDVDTGQIEVVLPATNAWADHVAWNPKGSKLAATRGRQAQVAAVGGRAAATVALPEVESTIAGLAWSPDGELLACACYGGVRLFDAKTGRRQRGLDWKGSMIGLAWSPTGKVIACGCQDNSVHFWRLPAGKDSQMSGYPCKPKAIAWSHDGRLLATSGAPEVTVWKFEGKGPEGTTPVELAAHEDAVTALAFAPVVNMLASGGRAGDGFVWAPDKIDRPVQRWRLGGRIEHLSWTMAPAEENVLFAAADDQGRVGVWGLR